MENADMIFCCGESLIDMLPRQLDTGEDVFLPVSGGAVFNTAITLGRLGARTSFVCGISNDMFGEQLIDSLKTSQVDTQYCVRMDCPTTLAFVKLTNGQAKYTFFDENSAGSMLDVDALPELPASVEALHFGAISLISEPCGTAFETLMTRHKDNAVISLDPNIRPSFIHDAAAHRARINRMIAMSDIVKVSDEDLDWLASGEHQSASIEAMLENGCAVVLLTKGSEGVDIFTKSGTSSVLAKKVDVVDTVGAGDSFNGGFLFGLQKVGLLSKSALAHASAEDLSPAVKLAVEVAAITVSRAGANPPFARELEIA